MRSPYRRPTAFAILLAALVAVPTTPVARAAEESLQAIIDRVENDNQCKVLSVQEMESNGRRIYVIKTLTEDGRVKVVQVRASD